jgi:Zn-dependent protease
MSIQSSAPVSDVPIAPSRCGGCGAEVPAGALCCPLCRRLVHGAELSRLAGEAQAATARGDSAEALRLWQAALSLLPPGSRQHRANSEKVRALSPAETSAETGHHGSGASKAAAGLGGVALLLWKLKFVAILVLTKGKLLLLGLTKASTLFSMALAFAVYWREWGWPFALGLVLSIYVHEMGHVAAAARFGLPVSAPLFIPGLGALIRLKQHPPSPMVDSRMGLAGPIWGLGAAVASGALFLATANPIFAAIMRTGAWINLFNLTPIGPLDGSRGIRALSRGQGWLVVAALGAMLFVTGEPLLWLVLMLAVVRAVAVAKETPPDWTAAGQFVVLILALSLLCKVPVVVAGVP